MPGKAAKIAIAEMRRQISLKTFQNLADARLRVFKYIQTDAENTTTQGGRVRRRGDSLACAACWY